MLLSFCTNLWKRIQRVGLQQCYNNDDEFTNTLRMLAALAFVPPQNVIEAFEELCNHITNLHNDDVNEIIWKINKYIYKYIGRFRGNGTRRAPTFTVTLWNMFHRTFDELPRTSNSIEG